MVKISKPCNNSRWRKFFDTLMMMSRKRIIEQFKKSNGMNQMGDPFICNLQEIINLLLFLLSNIITNIEVLNRFLSKNQTVSLMQTERVERRFMIL